MKNIKILLLAILSTVLLALFNNCGKAPSTSDPEGVTATPTPVTKIEFSSSIAEGGVFDPSMMLDPATGKLWMSFSAVNKSAMWPTYNEIAPHTRLAYSVDGGENWTDAGAANAITDVNITVLPAPNHTGTWMNEVSTLVYDPGAAVNQRWKLMWQTFMKINGSSRYEHSWIAMKMASTPEGLLTATAIKLFTSFAYDTGNDSGVSPTAPPITGAAAIQIDTAFAALNTCIVGEPALYATASALYMAIQCEQFNGPGNAHSDRMIFLLKCTSPCNVTSAAAWTYLGEVFRVSDAIAVDANFDGGFAAPAFAQTSNGVFLIVTPTEDPDALYRGCQVYKFSDLETATIEKVSGVAKLYASSGPTTDTFNGACTYNSAATASGILRSELGTSSPSPWNFQIFRTRTHF